MSDAIDRAVAERKRTSGVFSALFGAPPSSRGPVKRVTCLTCLSDDIAASKAARLPCGHIMCNACLKRIFVLSVSDPQHMPPRCCTRDHIPLKHVDRLFSVKFKMLWNRKYQEFTTKNRIYCPSRGCGEWIKPSNIYADPAAGPGRKSGFCSRCKTKVCCLCNGKWHGRRDCPKDEETQAFVEIAKREGWQRCHNCSAMIELKEGRCNAEFCMICGAKWKTCNCPWFNYEQVEADRRNHLHGAPPPPPPPLDYRAELGHRQRQEAADELLARRLQTLNVDLEHDPYRGGPVTAPEPLDPAHFRRMWYGGDAGRVPAHAAARSPRAPEGRSAAPGPPGRHSDVSPSGTRTLDPPMRAHSHASRPDHPPPTPRLRASGRVMPARISANHVTEYVVRLPEEPSRRPSATRSRRRPDHDPRRRSVLAGLARGQAQGGRVDAWLQHVEDGLPEDDLRQDHISVVG
ncbi:MAG: hypothetical protein M1826_001290 [Phylliscum demangeonii]|nr:MAG: hypothetical protein M1826_001290 [Phylliscum demangeonii]